jgi:hypothetical protein
MAAVAHPTVMIINRVKETIKGTSVILAKKPMQVVVVVVVVVVVEV